MAFTDPSSLHSYSPTSITRRPLLRECLRMPAGARECLRVHFLHCPYRGARLRCSPLGGTYAQERAHTNTHSSSTSSTRMPPWPIGADSGGSLLAPLSCHRTLRRRVAGGEASLKVAPFSRTSTTGPGPRPRRYGTRRRETSRSSPRGTRAGLASP